MPLMTYMLIDSMSDSMRMNALRTQGYHVGGPPVVVRTGPSGMTIFFVFLLIVVCGVLFVAWLNNQ